MVKDAIRLRDFRPEFDEGLIVEKSGGMPDKVKTLVQEAGEHARGAGGALIVALEFPDAMDVLLGDKKFTSPLLAERLAGHSRAFPYIATEGPELAAWGEKYKNTPEAAIAHVIRQVAVKACEQAIEAALCDKFAIPVLSSLNPGSLRDWPLGEQKHLLDLLAPIPGEIGVTLLPSSIMQPDYTISGIFYQTGKKIYNCQFCPRDNCPNRKAPRSG